MAFSSHLKLMELLIGSFYMLIFIPLKGRAEISLRSVGLMGLVSSLQIVLMQ
jgi:hypothetical protein